jgi:hypothetical protein
MYKVILRAILMVTNKDIRKITHKHTQTDIRRVTLMAITRRMSHMLNMPQAALQAIPAAKLRWVMFQVRLWATPYYALHKHLNSTLEHHMRQLRTAQSQKLKLVASRLTQPKPPPRPRNSGQVPQRARSLPWAPVS